MTRGRRGSILLYAATAIVLAATLAAFWFGVMLVGLSAFSGEAAGLTGGAFALLLIEMVIAKRRVWPWAARLWHANL